MNGIVKITALKGDQVLVKVNRGVPSDLLATITMVKDESVAAKDESVAAKDESVAASLVALQVSALLGEVPLIQPDDANKYLKVKSDETGYELDVIDLSSKENALGNPASDGMKLVSTVAGVRSWAEDSGGAAIGTGNYIAEPFAVTAGTGLEVSVAANRCVIDETVCESTTATTVALVAKAAQLIYKKKDNTYDKLLPKMTAADLVDANTVGLWFPDGSATVPNAAVGVNGNTLAVANNLTKTGTITAVDGWAGGDAAKGDGSTGYYTSANSTGFPTSSAAREITIVGSPVSLTGTQFILYYGGTNSNQGFGISTGGTRLYISNATGVDTVFDFEIGKKYIICLGASGGSTTLTVNGVVVFVSTGITWATTAAVLKLFANAINGNTAAWVCDFIQFRNALRTPAQIAALAQKLLLPCVGMTNANLQGSPISGGDYAGTPASYAYDGNASNEWSSSQTSSHAGVSYIGRSGLTSKITKVKWVNSSIAGRNMNNFKYQYSFDGTTWIDLVAVYHIGTASAVFYDDIPEYPVAPYFRAMALDSLGGGSSWGVADIVLYTGVESQTDIRNTLPIPAESQIVAYAETSATGIQRLIDPSDPKGATPDWAYGMRVGPMGALNRRKFLGWKYFSGGAYLYWDNPFDGRRANSHYVWASDTNGKNELRCMEDPNYGIVVLGTSAIPFGVNTSSNGVCRLNGTWQTSGYIGAYAEVID